MNEADANSQLFLMVGLGLFFVLTSIPLIRRKVKPNRLFGFRTRRTLENPDIWYDVNAYYGRCLAWAGAATALTALALMAFPDREDFEPMLVCLAVMMAGVFGGVFATWRYLKSYDEL